MRIRAEPLTEDAYAPYGRVIEARPGGRLVNEGMALRNDEAVDIESHRPGAKLNTCVFRCTPLPASTLDVKVLEKHPSSTQVFIPLAAERYLVVVALGGDLPDLATLRAFVATGRQAIAYAPGVWHHPMVGLDRETDFVALVWEDGTEGDCVVWRGDGGIVSI